MNNFFKSLNKKKFLLAIFIIVLCFSLIKTLQKGITKVDEFGYITNNLMQLNYQYHNSWETIPTEYSQTFYLKDENGQNYMLITIYSFPLNLVGISEEDSYEDIALIYKEVYETIDGDNTTLDGRDTIMLKFFSKDENLGGEIYITTDDGIGYSILFTEYMDTMSDLEYTEIRNTFLNNITIN